MPHEYDVRKKAVEDGSVLVLGEGEVGKLLRARYGREGEWYDLTDYVAGKIFRGGMRLPITPDVVHDATGGEETALATTYVRTMYITYAALASLRVRVHSTCDEVSGVYDIAGVYKGMPLYLSENRCSLYYDDETRIWRLANRRNHVIFESAGVPDLCSTLSPSGPNDSADEAALMAAFSASRATLSSVSRGAMRPGTSSSVQAPPLIPLPSIVTGWHSVSTASKYQDAEVVGVEPDDDTDAVREWYATSRSTMKDTSQQQHHTMDRLAQPKATVAKFKNESKRRLVNNQLGQRPEFTMTTLFPTSKSFREGGLHEVKIPKASPADDWTQMVRDGGADREVVWLYISVDVMGKAKEGQLSLQNVQEIVGKAQRAIAKLLGAHGVRQYVSKTQADAGSDVPERDASNARSAKRSRLSTTPPPGSRLRGSTRSSSPTPDETGRGSPRGHGLSVKIAHQTLTVEAMNSTLKLQSPTTRKQVKQMIQAPQRFGILCDIITTRRCVYTGSPHLIASAIYKFVEEKYPISVRFAFVGITDNASKRVARDMFYKGALPVEQGGSGKNIILNNPFRTGTPLNLIDNEHQYAVNPYADYERQYFKGVGEERRLAREKIRKDRYETPKYVAPLPPAWLERAQARLEKLKHQEAMSQSGTYVEHCARCWMSSPPPGSPSAAAASAARDTPPPRLPEWDGESEGNTAPSLHAQSSAPATLCDEAAISVADDTGSLRAPSTRSQNLRSSSSSPRRGLAASRGPPIGAQFLDVSLCQQQGDSIMPVSPGGSRLSASQLTDRSQRDPQMSTFLQAARRRSRIAQQREYEDRQQSAKEAVKYQKATFEKVMSKATKGVHPHVLSIPAVKPVLQPPKSAEPPPS